ncbi:MAG: FAD-dependent oxidoreductase [Pseudanabaenaceae cyanobacterium SKYGB_i_bin29]|nr:FAD-dependent oxidoreductase [Pseudanabaenaceae cyanobacterium SKYGB_i_bin29]
MLQRWLGLGFLVAVCPLFAWGQRIDRELRCDILIVGGGLAGSGAAYEALLAGRTVCLTEITDWVGGQISAQGTAALDERPTQRELLFFDRGYRELRDRIVQRYGRQNPGGCWVSAACFLPKDGHEIILAMLQEAEQKGKGKLHLLLSSVVKDLEIKDRQIRSAIVITHTPAPGAFPLNTLPLSQLLPEAYSYENSPRFTKTITRVIPQFVIEATETGEIVALADVPYRLGIDARSVLEPSSSSAVPDPYCTQGFTYTFAMEATAQPQEIPLPDFYQRYAPYYSYELPNLASFPFVFTYRRIFTPTPERFERNFPFADFKRDDAIVVGDISMQNWTWGNDYRPGTSKDNLIYTRDQLQQLGQLKPGGWQGGLRVETLRQGELLARGYFHWLHSGTTDSQLGDGVKKPYPNIRYLEGFASPMNTAHGLSKYPYIRESRRIIGRPGWGHPQGFTVTELDISRRDYTDPYYRQVLTPAQYRSVMAILAGLESATVITGQVKPEQVKKRSRSTIFVDSVGIGHYAIDFHPCMEKYPVELPGNRERPGERRAQGSAYPFQIPLRAMIPQKIDNLIVAGKSIATSHIAAAAYRVHSFEWSSGAAAGTTADFALRKGILPYTLVDDLPRSEPLLEELQQILNSNGNPTRFPDTSIFNNNWDNWR